MSNSDTKRAIVLMLMEAFQVDATKAMLQAYSIGLEGLTEGQVKHAAKRALQSEGRFMPRPGELRALAGAGVADDKQQAELAWTQLDRSLRSDETKQLDMRTRQAALKIGTFTELNSLSRKEWDFKRHQFINLWLAIGTEQVVERIENDCRGAAKLAGVNLNLKLIGNKKGPE